ncbi:MAG: peptidoglycan-binding protein, partial [Clostridia bacterium]|nr:peptidoglycan-binding protein [Clostridia bacterium]
MRYWRKRFALCMALAFMHGAFAESALTGEQVRQVEQALYNLGYHSDHFDSQLNGETRAALLSFQMANGLEATGDADAATLALLRSGDALSCHDYMVALSESEAALIPMESGATGEGVWTLQRSLQTLGYYTVECDGV